MDPFSAVGKGILVALKATGHTPLDVVRYAAQSIALWFSPGGGGVDWRPAWKALNSIGGGVTYVPDWYMQTDAGKSQPWCRSHLAAPQGFKPWLSDHSGGTATAGPMLDLFGEHMAYTRFPDGTWARVGNWAEVWSPVQPGEFFRFRRFPRPPVAGSIFLVDQFDRGFARAHFFDPRASGSWHKSGDEERLHAWATSFYEVVQASRARARAVRLTLDLRQLVRNPGELSGVVARRPARPVLPSDPALFAGYFAAFNAWLPRAALDLPIPATAVAFGWPGKSPRLSWASAEELDKTIQGIRAIPGGSELLGGVMTGGK